MALNYNKEAPSLNEFKQSILDFISPTIEFVNLQFFLKNYIL